MLVADQHVRPGSLPRALASLRRPSGGGFEKNIRRTQASRTKFGPPAVGGRKMGGKYSKNMFFDVFAPFLRSWRPGKACKGFLEAVRFIFTEYEPVGRHGVPNRMHFHHFLDHLALPARW